jgi:hypothetical protein
MARRLSLIIACAKLRYVTFLKLVTLGQANEIFEDGQTALHIFVETQAKVTIKDQRKDRLMRLRVVDKLLAWGADINLAGGPRVATPLQIAVGRRDADMAAHLMSRGAHMRVYSETPKWTPMHYATLVEKDDSTIPISKILMMYGAKPEEFAITVDFGVTHHSVNPSVPKFYKRIESTRATLTALIGSRQKSPTLRIVGKDIVRYLAKIIYQTRAQDYWAPPVKRSRKRHAP